MMANIDKHGTVRPNGWIDYGYANGWTQTPALIAHCQHSNHRTVTERIGNCLHEVSCDECCYTYRYDSSD